MVLVHDWNSTVLFKLVLVIPHSLPIFNAVTLNVGCGCLRKRYSVKNLYQRDWKCIIGDWRKLHTKELYNLYSLPNIITVVKLRGIR
jgi:hypothetical protein